MGENVNLCSINHMDVWYAVRTYHHQECEISNFLKQKSIPHFIPMMYVEKENGGEKPIRELIPVVHNLLFIQKIYSEKEMLHVLKDCNYSMFIMKKEKSNNLYEIPAEQMIEFRMLCDPDFQDTQYLKQVDVEAKPGKFIRVISGPLKGVKGKLVRQGNKYFIVKSLVGIGVMLHISRWNCEVLDH